MLTHPNRQERIELMKVVTLTDTLPALTEISQRLDKLARIERLIESKSTTCAAAIRDCRVGIKSALAGLLNKMEDRTNENVHAE